jgi:EAL domain-containing protein (putative c-di-GMP-specific phosphodiesterase class I)/PAS domain-containing protein
MDIRPILQLRAVRLAFSIVLCWLVGGLLAATMYWTLFDPRWTVFLGGVLFAGVLSLVSQASRAEWIVARRTRQLDKMRKSVNDAAARSSAATAAFQAADLRLRKLAEALRSAVLFVDRDQVCRFHNHALEEKVGPGAAIDGRPLREILGEALHAKMEPHIRASLEGEAASYELAWGTRCSVRQMPAGAELCLLFTPLAASLRETSPAPGEASRADERIAGENGETLYLHAIAKELTGWDDPKAKLTRALAEDKFLLLEQQIKPVDLGAPDPLCYEVLLRLQEEEDNLLPPGGFLPEAERFGMMEDLDRWVVQHLVTHCLGRRRAEPQWQQPLYCVNLSAASIRSEAFARFAQSQIESRKFDGRALCFEMDEHDVISLPAEARRLVAMLKPFGCRFTVDSFGSVKGTFAALEGLGADFIKIDGVIVQNLLRDPAQMARVRAMQEVCRKARMRTIAEFVEEPRTLAALRRVSVDYVQGFGIARPAPLAGATSPAAKAEDSYARSGRPPMGAALAHP